MTDLIERQPALEERAGIRFEGLLAILDEEGYAGEPRIEMLGEIVAHPGEKFASNVNVQFVCLNEKRQVLGTQYTSVSEGAYGYEAFQESVDLKGELAIIKIVPLCR
ncbi:hypothetical protein [Methylobacterium soli]|uniref:hypothetical protein n=1 Tax=Methylobacterium soli TaxID=553447 RepID=UPI0012493CDF|nr:hypothetical protein [Methylobacterium soli]